MSPQIVPQKVVRAPNSPPNRKNFSLNVRTCVRFGVSIAKNKGQNAYQWNNWESRSQRLLEYYFVLWPKIGTEQGGSPQIVHKKCGI